MKKWYLEAWFISLMFSLSFLIVPLIIGIILLILYYVNQKEITKRYGAVNDLDMRINHMNQHYTSLENDFTYKFNAKKELENQIQSLEKEVIVTHYNFSDYEAITSEECKNQLSILKVKEAELIKQNKALRVTSAAPKKVLNDNIKQLLRCFNSECDNIIIGVTVKNIDPSRNKIKKSFDSLNKIFTVDGITITTDLLEMKLEELNLIYTYELKKQQEKEIQKEIKAQMLEEEKVRKEIEREKKKIEKEETQFNNELKKMMSYLQKTDSEVEKQLYIDKIKALEEKLTKLESDKKNVLDRETNTRAGFVYVISNIGSFGESVYKIGMTRRLEPMDRVNELGSASVPFKFDVHAMIFSDDAPRLENQLHKYFEKNQVNKVNTRKEFFRVNLDEIETLVNENHNNTVIFTKIPIAEEYRQTLLIEKDMNETTTNIVS